MRPDESPEGFQAFLARTGVDLHRSAPQEGPEQMLTFFATVAAEGCQPDDGDMLLFQWGTYDWGEGPAFEIGLVRQFIGQGEEDDDAMSQLSLTYRFEAEPSLLALGAGDRWCEGPTQADALRAFIHGSPAFQAVATRKSLAVLLEHTPV